MSLYPTPSPLPLFDKPRTRATDPKTSHEAEAHIRKSGKLNEQQRAVLFTVNLHPGDTAREYDDVAKMEGVFHRRLVELERKGFVRRGEARKCRIGPTRAATWFAVEKNSLDADPQSK